MVIPAWQTIPFVALACLLSGIFEILPENNYL
jgi:hypothetical protein